MIIDLGGCGVQSSIAPHLRTPLWASQPDRTSTTMATMDSFLEAAISEARLGLREGGIPIGSDIVHGGKIIGREHNRRVSRCTQGRQS
jgi:hypothetical protein